MNDPLAAIRKRHNDIPQDALFDMAPEPTGGGEDVIRTRPPKSVRWATCPHHTPYGKNQLTGLIPDGKQLVFRDHVKHVGKSTTRCPGSGQPAPTPQEGTS